MFGATFMSIAPESPLVDLLIQGRSEEQSVRDFVSRVRHHDRTARTDAGLQKEGLFTGCYARNPLTDNAIPIWVANFVLYEYGTGAIMAVPAHDQRDFEFARQSQLPIRLVIQNPASSLDLDNLNEAYTNEEGYLVNSDRFSGLQAHEGKAQISQWIEEKGLGTRTIHYRLRDWGVSPTALLGHSDPDDQLLNIAAWFPFPNKIYPSSSHPMFRSPEKADPPSRTLRPSRKPYVQNAAI